MILQSRYKDIITEFDPNTNIIKTNSEYLRIGYEKDNSIAFIDPEGGPFIEVGSKLSDKTIKAIERVDNNFKIIFENE